MRDNDDFYRNFSNSSRRAANFGTAVLLPFISGVLATLLILSICFGVPSIKEKLIGTAPSPLAPTSDSPVNVSASSQKNVAQISLSNFTDTAVFAANAVLPSIVGISVEYNVISPMYSSSVSTGTAQGSRNNY